jgi:hypothetical protein
LDQPPALPEAEKRIVYPPPPNVHWGVLFIAQIVIAIFLCFLVPKAYWSLVSNLSLDAWAIYLCLWIRRLEPGTMSIYWCAAYVALQISFNIPGAPVPANTGITLFAAALGLICIAMWIATIFLIRAELHYHYNQREPVGLYLGGVMTFFFSFLYFQYHLYKIAQLREQYGDRPFYYQGGVPLNLPEM